MEEFLTNLLFNYPLLAPILFILVRTVPIVIAPIPGILVDAIGIFVFGWAKGFILAMVGIMLGAMAAFWIGRYFREPLVRRFASLRKVHEWEDKYSERQKFWALVFMRITTSPLFDYVSYAAGLSKISAAKFFFSTFIGTLPLVFGFYYFGGLFFSKGLYTAIALFSILFVLWVLFKKTDMKDYILRFLERKKTDK